MRLLRLPALLPDAGGTVCLLVAVLTLSACPGVAQSRTSGAGGRPVGRGEAAGGAVGERRAGKALEAAKAAGPLALNAYLERMPKGADLHMHLSGAVYAETFLKDGAEDGLCVDTARLGFVKAAEGTGGSGVGACGQGSVPAAAAFKDQHLYDALVDAFSMRSFVATPSKSGHDQFFETFDRFGGTSKRHRGEWLDEVASRAAAENEQYLEIMETPTFTRASALGYTLGWPLAGRIASTAASSEPEDGGGASAAELRALREKLLAGGLRDEVATDRAEFAAELAERARIERCDGAGATERAAGCGVEIRFLYQVLRAFPPQQVFAQTLLAFEVADAEAASGHANVVGLNFVQPEDAYLAMSEYHRQMLMLDYLHGVYPRVRIALHAGELAPGMVPPAGLSFHIREAVELGHAERIGHGVDVMYEHEGVGRGPEELLGEMLARHVMVEVNLSSNDVILGVAGNHHSLPAYLRAGVPVALSTDDEGVSRINLTHEYARAATEFSLSYLQLKRMARTSIEHSFLPGASLWSDGDGLSRMAAPCGSDGGRTSVGCAGFLQANPRAAQEWELERRFVVFESRL